MTYLFRHSLSGSLCPARQLTCSISTTARALLQHRKVHTHAYLSVQACREKERERESGRGQQCVGDVFSFSRHGRCSELPSLSTRFFFFIIILAPPPFPTYFSPRALVDRCLPSHFSDGPHIVGINYLLLVSPSSKLLFLCACSSLPVPLLNGACICRTAAWTLSVGAIFHLFTPLNMLYRPSLPPLARVYVLLFRWLAFRRPLDGFTRSSSFLSLSLALTSDVLANACASAPHTCSHT